MRSKRLAGEYEDLAITLVAITDRAIRIDYEGQEALVALALCDDRTRDQHTATMAEAARHARELAEAEEQERFDDDDGDGDGDECGCRDPHCPCGGAKWGRP